ncbi:MAG TPA: hypothetical protein VFL42_13640 [Terriglobales bacterium]|nr:hypothetical protein [Terriglobales bacterium]
MKSGSKKVVTMPRRELPKRSVHERLREEIRKVAGIALFFAVAFSIIIFADSLTGSGGGLVPYSKAIIGGLIVAKVLLIVDLWPGIDRFKGKPLIHNILWKSSLYTVASLVFRFIDPMITFLFKGQGLAAGFHEAVQSFTRPRFWAVEIWVAVILLIYVTTREFIRVMGKDQMRVILLGR